MIRTGTVDGHPIVREGLVAALDDESDRTIAGAVGAAEELIERCGQWRPDIVLLDFEMPGLSGVEAVRELVRVLPNGQVIVFTAYADDERIIGAVRSGAKGYVLKGAPA